jgi:TolB-like protein
MLSSLDLRRTSSPDAPPWRERGSGKPMVAPSRSVSEAKSSPTGSERIQAAQARPAESPQLTSHAPDGFKGSPPPSAVVLQQLDRILRSKTFVQSEKLSRFLRFVVEHVLDSNPECLKEYLVGVEVYDRKPPYDPSQDSIVRTEARRLRNKLKEYYGAEGKDDPVYIYLRPGSYIPAFQFRDDLAGAASPVEQGVGLPYETSSIITAILPFADISANPLSAAYARGIPDELAFVLMQNFCCTVISPSSTACLAAQGFSVTATMKKLGAQIAFEGSTRAEGSRLRITARIVDVMGIQLWVKRVDIEVGPDASFAVEEELAKAVAAGFDVVRSQRLALMGERRSSEGIPAQSSAPDRSHS